MLCYFIHIFHFNSERNIVLFSFLYCSVEMHRSTRGRLTDLDVNTFSDMHKYRRIMAEIFKQLMWFQLTREVFLGNYGGCYVKIATQLMPRKHQLNLKASAVWRAVSWTQSTQTPAASLNLLPPSHSLCGFTDLQPASVVHRSLLGSVSSTASVAASELGGRLLLPRWPPWRPAEETARLRTCREESEDFHLSLWSGEDGRRQKVFPAISH